MDRTSHEKVRPKLNGSTVMFQKLTVSSGNKLADILLLVLHYKMS